MRPRIKIRPSTLVHLITIPADSLRRSATTSMLCCLVLGLPVAASGQGPQVTPLDFGAASQFEDYLRVLALTDKAPLYPWSIRGFSRREVERLAAADSTGPWRLKSNFRSSHLGAGPLVLGATFNSAYPYGANDGPLWTGRGLTLAGTGGVSGYAGPFSFALVPMAFWAANRPFPLLPNGLSGAQAFNHGTVARYVDLPQRFGNSPYSRIDPGNSFVRMDSRFVTVGVSTADEWIGPATEYPFLLSNNAPGFPHLFAGTGDPWNVGIGRVQGRVAWGRLTQSAYSPVTGSTHYLSADQPGTVRLATFAEGVLLPRGIPGLELGVGRFIHVPYRPGEPAADFWKKPFKVFFLKNEYASGDTVGADNQLASIFFRWVFPHSGVEVYGERGYEDQFYDLREFIENIDHDREYMLGLQKILATSSTSIDVLKAEVVNYQLSTQALIRTEGAVYQHATLRQGHTNDGQLLGTSAGVNAAAASTVSWTRYSQTGRTSLTLRRVVRDQRGDYYLTGVVDPKGSDVLVAAGLERMRFGHAFDFGGKVEAMEEYNRNFARDVPNLNLQLTVRLHP